jgi:hypothetical protein
MSEKWPMIIEALSEFAIRELILKLPTGKLLFDLK